MLNASYTSNAILPHGVCLGIASTWNVRARLLGEPQIDWIGSLPSYVTIVEAYQAAGLAWWGHLQAEATKRSEDDA